jgi:hypothetical protein
LYNKKQAYFQKFTIRDAIFKRNLHWQSLSESIHKKWQCLLSLATLGEDENNVSRQTMCQLQVQQLLRSQTFFKILPCIIKHVPSNKSCLQLKNPLENTQIFQLFTKLSKMESIWKSNKMPSWKAWVLRPSGLIKVEGSKRFYWNYLVEVENAA